MVGTWRSQLGSNGMESRDAISSQMGLLVFLETLLGYLREWLDRRVLVCIASIAGVKAGTGLEISEHLLFVL